MSASCSGRGGCTGTECLWSLFETEIRIALCRDGHRPRQSDAARATGCCGMPAPVRAPRAPRATRPLEAPGGVRERFLSFSRLKSRLIFKRSKSVCTRFQNTERCLHLDIQISYRPDLFCRTDLDHSSAEEIRSVADLEVEPHWCQAAFAA